MALSSEGEALTAAHQRAQRALTGNALKQLTEAWDEVDPEDHESWLRYLARAEELCSSAQTASADVAFRYLDKFRRAELKALGAVVDGLSVARPGLVLGGQVEAALGAFGPSYVRRLVAGGKPLEEAKRLALSGQFGDVVGLILGSGRQVIASGIDRDRKCLGYRRCCSGGACSFCAMLATRGAVYKSNSFTGNGAAKGAKKVDVHRSCQCSLEPVYSHNSRPTEAVQRMEALWKKSGGDPKEFRRLVEGRTT
ncbi:VG15 protein [Kitasatospora sp. NPDC001132]